MAGERAGAEWRRRLGVLALAVLAGAAAWSAWKKGGGPGDRAPRPEWSYYQQALEGELALHEYGYLPGVYTVLRPFLVLPHPSGLAVFIALTTACAALGLFLLWRELGGRLPAAWGAVWLAAPWFLAVQNNQLVAPMAALTVAGVVLMRRERGAAGALSLAGAAALKTLPVTLAMFLLLRRKWMQALAFLVFLAAASFLLTAADRGFAGLLDRHLSWLGGVNAQNPLRVLEEGVAAHPFFGDNQSPAAWAVRAAPHIGETAARLACYAILPGTLLLAAAAVLLRWRERPLAWEAVALWLAWTAFAAPYGRYYYLVLLVPGWLVLADPGGRFQPAPRYLRGLGWALPLLAWGGRTDGVYALLSGATFAALLTLAFRRQPAAAAGSAPSSAPRSARGA